MKHENIVKIYYQDTDCYGIVWHGAYIKWLEIGRVELSKLVGIDFKVLNQMEILLPVVNLNCRYKHPSRLFDDICITTSLEELKKSSITFGHVIENINTKKIILQASTTIVTTDNNGKLFRVMPEYLYSCYKKLETTSAIACENTDLCQKN